MDKMVDGLVTFEDADDAECFLHALEVDGNKQVGAGLQGWRLLWGDGKLRALELDSLHAAHQVRAALKGALRMDWDFDGNL